MSCEVFTMYEGEVRTFTLNFSQMPEVADDSETLTTMHSQPASTPTGLTLASATVASPSITFKVTVPSSTAGNTYKVRAIVNTSGTHKLAGEITIEVK